MKIPFCFFNFSFHFHETILKGLWKDSVTFQRHTKALFSWWHMTLFCELLPPSKMKYTLSKKKSTHVNISLFLSFIGTAVDILHCNIITNQIKPNQFKKRNFTGDYINKLMFIWVGRAVWAMENCASWFDIFSCRNSEAMVSWCNLFKTTE